MPAIPEGDDWWYGSEPVEVLTATDRLIDKVGGQWRRGEITAAEAIERLVQWREEGW